ncbi:MAG: hypothetical protein M1819_001779 [Sarea resinae]|nr:MAG: hypothetical protein M1819_001779 [Sarea resinae]
MAEASAASPGSAGDSNTPAKAPASKDKHCPYCDQAFTSSSLGRHLDLYIRDKNPKPPDGVHNVDEIRKLRGGITRRQARNSSAKREGSTPTTAKASPMERHRSPSAGRSQFDSLSVQRVRTRFNEPSWQATGVIRDIPTTPRDHDSGLDGRRDVSRLYQRKKEFELKQKMLEEKDNAYAAELALKEVLGSVKAASAQVNSPSPFDFNPLTLTFPALCLRCLSAPSTLFSTQPFATNLSWPLEPPGQGQYETLRYHFQDRFHQWRIQRAASAERERRGSPAFLNGNHQFLYGQDDNQNEQQQQEHIEEDKVIRHLADAFGHWKSISDKQKHEYWRLETLRAFARAEEKRKETQSVLEMTQQEVEHLKEQVDRLNRCQQPREFLIQPPTTIPLLKNTAKELNVIPGADFRGWDYDRLVAKWKAVIQDNRRSSSGMAGQRSLSVSAVGNVSQPEGGASGTTNGGFGLPTPGMSSAGINGVSSYRTNGQNGPREGVGAGGSGEDEIMDDASMTATTTPNNNINHTGNNNNTTNHAPHHRAHQSTSSAGGRPVTASSQQQRLPSQPPPPPSSLPQSQPSSSADIQLQQQQQQQQQMPSIEDHAPQHHQTSPQHMNAHMNNPRGYQHPHHPQHQHRGSHDGSFMGAGRMLMGLSGNGGGGAGGGMER